MNSNTMKFSMAKRIALSVVLVTCIYGSPWARADGVVAGASGGGSGLSCFDGLNDSDSVATANVSCSNQYSAAAATGTGYLATGTIEESAFGAGAPQSYGNGRAEVSFLYQFAITGAPAAGGTVVFSGSLDGTASDSCDENSTCSNAASLYASEPYGGFSFPETIVGSPSINQLVLYPPTNYSFQISEVLSPGSSSFLFGIELVTTAICTGSQGSINSCSADTDFSHTLQITGAQVFDSNGNLVPDASLISQSGFNPNAIQAPEPSSLLLLGSGLLGIVALYRRWLRTAVG